MKVTKAFELKIDNPCTEDFDAMPRTNCGMFCGKCQKEVIDFTTLTDVELIDILKRKPDTCGVYRNDQLNKFYQYDEIVTEKKPFRLWIGIMTFIALLGFRSADAQVKGKHAQHKTTATKHIPKNARIYCKYVDSDDRPLAHVKVTAGIEQTETDENGLFDIANPFSATTQMVAVNFEENGVYQYGQLRAKDVQDVVFVFKFAKPLLSPGDAHPARLTREDILRSGGVIDISRVVTTSGGGMVTNGRSNGIIAAGGSRGTSTVTIIDGVVINGDQHIAPKKQSFFRRLFGRKAK